MRERAGGMAASGSAAGGKMEKNLDKRFLLTYTATGPDGFRHSYHAWFGTEDELMVFVQEERAGGRELETDLAVEILEYRAVSL